jgi:hypothetical protein
MKTSLKNILQENMQRFGTKNLKTINETVDFEFAKKASYDTIMDIMDASEDLAEALNEPSMEQLPVVQHAIKQLNIWTKKRKPAPLSVYVLVQEAPALLDKMQAKSKNAWMEMRSHWGGIVDAIADEDESEYVTDFDANDGDMI